MNNESDKQQQHTPSAAQTSLAALICALFRAFRDGRGQNVPKAPLEARWRAVLGLRRGASLYLALSQVEQALDRLNLQIQALPGHFNNNKEISKKVVNDLRNSVHPAKLVNSIDQIMSLLDEEKLSKLDMLSDILKLSSPEVRPVEGEIQKLLGLLDNLDKAIAKAPFTVYVRTTLIAHLEALRWSVVNWHLIGSDGVATATGSLFYSVYLAQKNAAVSNPEKKTELQSVSQKLSDVIDWIGRILIVKEAYKSSADIIHSTGIQGILGP